jgi:hypothetical protein
MKIVLLRLDVGWMKMPDVQSNNGKGGGNTHTPTDLLRRMRISFLVTSGLVMVFAALSHDYSGF